MKASDHFSVVADAYALRRPAYPDELFAFLAGAVAGHDLAWDCAAGSGQASIPLTRYFRRVIATDSSSAMLAKAPVHPSVEYRRGSAYDSALEAGSADLVSVAQALHWFERELFYAEAHRVLKPGGILAVWTYGACGCLMSGPDGNQLIEDQAVTAVVTRFYHEVVGPYWPLERCHVEAGYSTISFPYPELDHPDFQMQQHWTLDELLGYIGTWSATQLYRDATGSDPIPELGRELQRLWGDNRSSRLVRWPLTLRVGRRPE
ncbi:MAG: class I SAM-dependent methyltransferase [Gemmatimonadales bacterium]